MYTRKKMFMSSTKQEIALRLEAVEGKIKAAAERAGRKREDILLLAVTKTMDIPVMKAAQELGLTHFGENKPQEINRKYPEFEGISWHQIGHLQTNKIKYILDKVCLIHSVDSLHLGEEISKRAQKPADILVEVNISGDEAKHGIKPEEADTLVSELSKLENIRVKGLMTVAPFVQNPEENRRFFKKMYELSVDIQSKNYDNVTMEHLSMGMTNDYEVAIEEGATIVRIGTGLFGARDYSK